MRKISAIVLTVLLLISVVSCSSDPSKNTSTLSVTVSTDKNGQPVSTASSSKRSMTLYFCHSDSLDPYKAQSSGNQALCSLLFDSLVKLDNNLNYKKILANDVSIDNKTITVTLNNYMFSDGTAVTADDVIYSINRCKKAKSGGFVNQLENVKSFTTQENKIIINLKRNDRNAIKLLDFPILKKGSEKQKNDDGKILPPIGSGRYILVDNYGEYSLAKNDYYYGTKPKSNIILKNIPDTQALEYLIRSSSINVYYNGQNYEKMPELKGKNQNITLTDLVYLGINQKNGLLKDPNIRKALSAAADRKNISEKCYNFLAKPATSLYNDKNDIIKDENPVFNLEDNTAACGEFLKNSGYDKLNSSGFYKNSNEQFISLNLLYNKDNNVQSMTASGLIKQFKAGGISIVDNGVSSAQYKNLIAKKNYDIYLAEIRLTKSFDYTDLLKNKNVLSSNKFLKVYQQYMKEDISVNNMLNSFSENMPFIPLAFRLGTVSYSDNFSKELISSISDPYYNLESISLK